MNSYEVIRKAIEPLGVKSVASEMKLSPALVYKWCEPKATATDAGAQNPLDRVLQLYELTGDVGPIEWLCQKSNGVRVSNPEPASTKKGAVLESTQAILKEFSELLHVVSESYENDGQIDRAEAKRIRQEWERLKVLAETFVLTCEHGNFDKTK